MQENPVLIEEKSKNLYKWAGITIIITIVVLMCASLPFIVVHKSSKIMLCVMIAIVVVILIVTIVTIEMNRRRSQIRRRNVDENWTSETISLQNKKSEKSKRFSERSSWISWFPRKLSPTAEPTAPPLPLETEIY